MSLPDYRDLGDGVFCIDTAQQRPRMAACYLVIDGDEAAFIDTGVSHGVPGLLALIAHLGLAREQLRWVMPTHVHLDHAGGAGQLMQLLPRAQLVVHPRGARHMIDPSRLEAGARAVYGDHFDASFGSLLPVPAERVVESTDGGTFALGGREFVLLHTEGHARHHYCVHDPGSGSLFSGDSFGVCYPDMETPQGPFIFPPTTPVQFDPPAWIESLGRLRRLLPRRVCLTHFGAVTGVDALAEQLAAWIGEFAALARECAASEAPQDCIRERVGAALRAAAAGEGRTYQDEEWEQLMGMDLTLNAQGLAHWLEQGAR